MLGNFLFTLFYLFIGLLFAVAAWTHTVNAPAWMLWLAAGAFVLVGLWRLLHLSKGG
jgi:small-conductance mechanosensitive channel